MRPVAEKIVVAQHALLSSPIGDLHVFGAGGRLVSLTLPNETQSAAEERLRRRFRRDRVGVRFVEDEAALREPMAQLVEYFAGQRCRFDLALDHGGTPFQGAVWDELARIPFGETRSYGDLARAIGRPTATRAVGAANGNNPLPIVLPCHRVIGSDGTLTGFGGGLPLKERLLAWERGGFAAW